MTTEQKRKQNRDAQRAYRDRIKGRRERRFEDTIPDTEEAFAKARAYCKRLRNAVQEREG